MKFGAIILSRYNSSRLPGKALKDFNGKAIIKHIYDQLTQVEELDEVIIATSVEDSDDKIESYCKAHDMPCYRGSLNDVAKRFLNAASHFNLDYAFRINGDNVFINTDLIKEMIQSAQENKVDFLSNVPGRSFGFGMSIEGVKTKFYELCYEAFESDYYKEHVTAYLYDNPEIGSRQYFENTRYPNLRNKKLAVDTSEDYEKLQELDLALKDSQQNCTFMLQKLNQLLEDIE